MAKIFPIIVRRITEVVGGGNGFIASVIQCGLEMVNRFELIGGEVHSGIASEANRFSEEGTSTPQTPAMETALLGIEGEASESVDPAFASVPSIRDVAGTSTPQNSAIDTELLGVEGDAVLMAVDPAGAVAPSLRDVAATSTPQNPAIDTALLGIEGDAVLEIANPAPTVAQSLRDVDGSSTPQNPAIDTALLGIEGDAVLMSTAPAAAIEQSPTTVAGTSVPQNPAIESAQSLRDVAGSSTPQKPSLDTDLLGVTGTAVNAASNPAIDQDARISEFHISDTPAAEIVQIKIDLTHRSGSNSVTEANGTGGRQDFDTPANAAGLHNGTLCTCTGNVLGARNGRLNMAYADFPNKSSLTITQVNLHFYYKQTSLLAASSTGGYNFGGADTQLFSNAALSSPDYTSTPQTFDITSAVGGSWTNLNAIRAWIDAEISALALNDSVSMDAVELEVIATRTDSL